MFRFGISAAGCEKDTKATDKIKVGQIITVVSTRHNSNGQLRVEYGPLDIAWSEFDGGWVSVQTAAGDIAWEVYEDVASESEDNEEQLKEQEQTDVVEATNVHGPAVRTKTLISPSPSRSQL